MDEKEKKLHKKHKKKENLSKKKKNYFQIRQILKQMQRR